MSIEGVIYNRLVSFTEINNAVKGNVFPTWRDEATPSIIFDLNIDEVETFYEGTGPIRYELTVSCIADTLNEAIKIGDTVIDSLDRSAWSDGGFSVTDLTYRDREVDYIDQASKNKRLGVIDLRFDLTVDAATST